jgi:hypothetical protein
MNTRNALNYGTKMMISGMMMGLCAFHIVSDRTQQHQKLYISGLTATLAYLLPSPKVSTDEKAM